MAIGRPPSFGNQAVGRTANVGTSSMPDTSDDVNKGANGFIGKGDVSDRAMPASGFTGKGNSRDKPLPALPRGDPIDAQGNYARPPKTVDPIDAQGNYAQPGGARPMGAPAPGSVVRKGTSFDVGGAAGKARGWFSDALHTAASWANDNLVPDSLKPVTQGVIDDVHAGKGFGEVLSNAGQNAINSAGNIGKDAGGFLGKHLGGALGDSGKGETVGKDIGGALGRGVGTIFGNASGRNGNKRQRTS